MVEPLAIALRGVALGFAFALALATVWLSGRPRRALLPMLLCLMAYLVRSAPQLGEAPTAVLLPLAVGALLFPVAFWWLVHTAFEDRADLPWPAAAAALLLVAAGLLTGQATGSWLDDGPRALQKAVAAGFVVAALWRLWVSDAGDLVSSRRTVRRWLLAYIGAHGLVILAVELVLSGARPPAWLDAVNVAAIGVALAVALALLVRFHREAVETLFGTVREPDAGPAMPPAPAEPVVDDGPGDTPWIERLQRLMSDDRAYREPELSLADLAQRLGLPEYRLRELINRRLGYRNFPAFVNDYRLREVEARLAEPACDRLPILTLALEAGFGSIGPFNRAFRGRHGVTPTSFRNRRGTATPAT